MKQLDISLSPQVNTARLIRGYAANNSRALFRRRSSTTDYVSLGREQDSLESQDTFSQVKLQTTPTPTPTDRNVVREEGWRFSFVTTLSINTKQIINILHISIKNASITKYNHKI